MRNSLKSSRRTQRALRREFDAFTKANCPTCPTPCCVQPARIAPADILLAEATGWRSSIRNVEATAASDTDMVEEVASRASTALSIEILPAEPTPTRACEYLGARGCTFPTDLRPFGCTTYICKYMYERLNRPTLTRIKQLVRDLETTRMELTK